MDRKVYHIPRKVNEGFKFLLLSGRDFIILAPFLIFAIIILFFVDIPFSAKIIIVMLTVGPVYMGLAFVLDNGLRAVDYVKLLYRFYITDQNVYTLSSSNKRRDPYKRMQYIKPQRQPKEKFVLEGDAPDDEEDPEFKETALERLKPWLAKPKNLSNKNNGTGKEIDE